MVKAVVVAVRSQVRSPVKALFEMKPGRYQRLETVAMFQHRHWFDPEAPLNPGGSAVPAAWPGCETLTSVRSKKHQFHPWLVALISNGCDFFF